MVSWRETFQVWPALLVSGLSFAGMQFYWSNYQDIGLVDVVSAVFSLLVTVAFLKFWKPATVVPVSGELAVTHKRHSAAQVLKGWSPFIVASILIFITGLPSMAKYLNFDVLKTPMPYLHNAVLKMPPIAPKPAPEDATVNLNFVGIPGTVVFVAGLVTALFAGLPASKIFRLFKATVLQTMPSLLAISFMVGLAYVTRYCGMDTIIGLSLTGTGKLYPFFGTLLGWLGVALTGTDAGSNALFGNLQKVTAQQLGLSPILMGAANSTGGVMGKMIDAQSIVVSSSATKQQGNEAAIFKTVFWHSIALASIVGLIVLFYAYVIPWAIPG
jgi:lactate permease